jgi:translocator protein
MLLTLLGLVLLLLSTLCWSLVLTHAFSRSLGTGFMVLLIPVYNVMYAFTQFEHRRKGLVVSGWLGGFVAGVSLRAFALVAPL